jgi:phospholipase/carboxylesterase
MSRARTEGPQGFGPDAVVVEPRGPARATVILLHGLGADGHDLAPAVAHATVPPELGLRWILPHAAERSVGLAGGGRMRAWFDVAADDLRRGEATDLGGLKSADQLVRGLVEREIARGVPSSRIVIGGFSQGGALAVYSALRFEKPLAGAIALSTYLARNVTLEAQSMSANRGLPVFAAHGTMDRIVPVSRGRELKDRLVQLGCDVEYREYPMDHEVCVEELRAIGAWLAARVR